VAVFGYICSTDFYKEANFDEDLLSSLTTFEKLAGKLIGSPVRLVNSQLLSKRELEVMKRIAHGESTKKKAITWRLVRLL
jgi:hypothetical protein